MRVLIVGSVAYDTVETAVGKVECALGGAATYASVAAGFYCQPCMVGVVGDDFLDEHVDFLVTCGVDLCGLQRLSGKTFHWAGRYHEDMMGRDTLETQLNVFEHFDPLLPGELKKIGHVFLANIHPSLQKRVLDQVEDPELVVMDTMDLWINTARTELMELLPRVDILVINDEEVRMLMEDYNTVRAARNLMKTGIRLGVVVKRGEHGCTLVTKDRMYISPAFPVEELVDPTGAGDTFAGAFTGYLASIGCASPREIRDALLHGSAMASFTVEDFSMDRLKKLSRENIEERVSEIKQLMVFD